MYIYRKDLKCIHFQVNTNHKKLELSCRAVGLGLLAQYGPTGQAVDRALALPRPLTHWQGRVGLGRPDPPATSN